MFHCICALFGIIHYSENFEVPTDFLIYQFTLDFADFSSYYQNPICHRFIFVQKIKSKENKELMKRFKSLFKKSGKFSTVSGDGEIANMSKFFKKNDMYLHVKTKGNIHIWYSKTAALTYIPCQGTYII